MRDLSKAIDLIKQFEGCKLIAYKCPAGVWTVGYGSTTFEGTKVTEGLTITQQQAEDQLQRDLEVPRKVIDQLVTVPLNDNQYCALVDFIYNIGAGNFQSSTLLKKLNKGQYNDASFEFLRWNRSKGRIVNGLQRRREAEQALFNTP